MRLSRLRRYDVQARLAFIAALAAIPPCLIAAIQAYKRYDHQLRAIPFGESGFFQMGFLTCVGLALGLSVVGLALGFNSAGQRRNHLQRKSWAGFFIGMVVLSLSIVLLVAFARLRFEVVTGI